MPSVYHYNSDSSSESETSLQSKRRSNHTSVTHKRKKPKFQSLISRLIKIFHRIIYTPHLLKVIFKFIVSIALLFVFHSQLMFILNGVALVKGGVNCFFDPWGCCKDWGKEILGVGSNKGMGTSVKGKWMGMGEKGEWMGKTRKESNYHHTFKSSPYESESSPSSFNFPYQNTRFTSSLQSTPSSLNCDEIINPEDKFFLGTQSLLTFTDFSDPFPESLEQLILSLNITSSHLLSTLSPSPSPSSFSIFPNEPTIHYSPLTTLTTLKTTLYSLQNTLAEKTTTQKIYHKSFLYITILLTSTTHTYIHELDTLLTQLEKSIQKLHKYECRKDRNWMVKRWNRCNALESKAKMIIGEIQKVSGVYFEELRGVGVLEGLGDEVLEWVRKGREIGEMLMGMRTREREMENDIRTKVGEIIYQDFHTEMTNFFGEDEANIDMHKDGYVRESDSSPLQSFITETQSLEKQMKDQIQDIVVLKNIWYRLSMGEEVMEYLCFFPRMWKEGKEWGMAGKGEEFCDGVEIWIQGMRGWMRERERWVEGVGSGRV